MAKEHKQYFRRSNFKGKPGYSRMSPELTVVECLFNLCMHFKIHYCVPSQEKIVQLLIRHYDMDICVRTLNTYLSQVRKKAGSSASGGSRSQKMVIGARGRFRTLLSTNLQPRHSAGSENC